jgi:hypothetical protein
LQRKRFASINHPKSPSSFAVIKIFIIPSGSSKVDGDFNDHGWFMFAKNVSGAEYREKEEKKKKQKSKLLIQIP